MTEGNDNISNMSFLPVISVASNGNKHSFMVAAAARYR